MIYTLDSALLLYGYAAMAELVDALDSGSSRGNSVDVRVILAAISSFILHEYIY